MAAIKPKAGKMGAICRIGREIDDGSAKCAWGERVLGMAGVAALAKPAVATAMAAAVIRQVLRRADGADVIVTLSIITIT
jgi:hypothetical protein